MPLPKGTDQGPLPCYSTVCRYGTHTDSGVMFTVLVSCSDRGGSRVIAPTETYEGNVIHHDFLQFGKQHSRHEVILSSIVFVTTALWSLFHPFYRSETVMRLFYQILLKSSPATVLAGPAPVQWSWACSSLSAHSPAEASCKTSEQIVLLLIFFA